MWDVLDQYLLTANKQLTKKLPIDIVQMNRIEKWSVKIHRLMSNPLNSSF